MSDTNRPPTDEERRRIAEEDGPMVLPPPEGTPKPEHGAQVVLTGLAQTAARGAAHTTMLGNMQTMAAMEGGVHDAGASADLQRKLDPADGSIKERRLRERGEGTGRTPSGEDDEATGATTAPEALRAQVQNESTVAQGAKPPPAAPPAPAPAAPPPPAPQAAPAPTPPPPKPPG